MGGVFVVGSINQDFVLRVQRRPSPGETVTDAELSLHPGGKGANQAIAAARLGAEVTMLGRVGKDPFGEQLVENLGANSVNTEHVKTTPDAPTGSAFITVTTDGENTIIVSPGANRSFGPDEMDPATGDLESSTVLVAQLEVRVEAVERAASIATDAGCRFLLNLAPAREVSGELLQLCDPLIVNESEAAFLLGEEASPEESVRRLLEFGSISCVVTLGASGAVFATRETTQRYPAPEVEAVDATGAGDAFVGALAAKLAQDAPLEEAVPYAVLAGAVAVTHEGAQGALPTPEELEKLDEEPSANP